MQSTYQPSGGEFFVEAAMEAVNPVRTKMANTPSPKLVRCYNHVEEVEGNVAQLWARRRRRWCGDVGAKRRRRGAVLGGARLFPRQTRERALESEGASGSEWN